MKRLSYISLLVVIVSYIAGSWNSSRVRSTNTSLTDKVVLYYHCPMHPGIKSDKPGAAPCCGMGFVPVYSGQDWADSEPQPSAPRGSIRISPEKQQVIGVRTAAAEKSDVTRTLRLLGKVTADETRVYKIKAPADEWIQEIYPNTVGSLVKKGEPLASVYASDFLAAEQAYIIAANNARYANSPQQQINENQLR